MFFSTRQQVLNYEKEYMDNLSKTEKAKVENAPILLEKITRELEKNIINHQALLHEMVSLSDEIPKIRAARVKRLFKASFNFEHYGNEILKTDSPENLKYLIEPLLRPKSLKGFNINKLGEMFNYKAKVSKQEKKEVHEEEYVGDVYTIEDETMDRLKCNYSFYMKELLRLLKTSNSIDLNVFISSLVNKYDDSVIENRDFISFVYGLITFNKDTPRFLFRNLETITGLSGVHKAYLEVISEDDELENFKDIELVCTPCKTDYVELDEILRIRNMTIEVK